MHFRSGSISDRWRPLLLPPFKPAGAQPPSGATVTPHPTPSPEWGPSGSICPLCFSTASAGSKVWAGAPFYSSCLNLFSPPFSFSSFSLFLTLVGQFMVVTRIWRKYLLLLLGQPVTEKLKACGGGQALSSVAVMQELWHLIV